MRIVTFTVRENHEIEVQFSDGKTVIADFTEFLTESRNPLVNKFLDTELFKQVSLDEYGVLTWGDNEMDINPISIYKGDFARKLTQTS